jgi:hypothetical protein
VRDEMEERKQAKYKEWLENEGGKEGIGLKVRFIKNDYSAWSHPNPAWIIKISRCIGTIEIPENMFISKAPKFTEKELGAIGLHELGHLRTWKYFGFLGVLRRMKRQKWSESEADAYVKGRGFGGSFASGLKKSRELREKLSRKSWWRIKIWWRKRTLGYRYPDFNTRIKKLIDCPQKKRNRR